jgi:poly-gamma-glutamate capsule biosynthesis protein CapA/YwtB (metallophosphatase superfamily)
MLSDGMKFCGNLRHVDALKNAGIDVVSLANNHSLNFGSAGLLETKTIKTMLKRQSFRE